MRWEGGWLGFKRMTDDWRRCVVDPALRIAAELELTLQDHKSISPLSRAVLLGVPVVELKKYREYVDQVDDQGRTAIRYAVELGSLETTKELAEGLNANLDIADVDGTMPIHAACARGDAEIVEVLLRKIKHPLAVNKTGETPLLTACRMMSWELVPKLAKYGVGSSDSKGRTALHLILIKTTSITDCVEAVEALLANQADVNAQDMNGYSPLHVAAERGLSDACILLAKRGAKLNIPDKQGETPLHKSVSRPTVLQGKNCALQTLLDLKSDVTARRLDGKSADELIAAALAERTWTDSQKIAFEVARRRILKAMEDIQKV